MSLNAHCCICGPGNGVEDWVDHLTRKPHLRRSRRHFDFVGWSPWERRCSILVSSSFPLVTSTDEMGVQRQQDSAGVVTLLQKCGSYKGYGVRNFVVWTEKPYLSLIQFYNELAMEQGLKNLEARREGGILYGGKLDDDHLLEIRKLVDISEIQLTRMIPPKLQVVPPAPSQQSSSSGHPSEDEKDSEVLVILEDEEGIREVGGAATKAPPTLILVDDEASDSEEEELEDGEIRDEDSSNGDEDSAKKTENAAVEAPILPAPPTSCPPDLITLCSPVRTRSTVKATGGRVSAPHTTVAAVNAKATDKDDEVMIIEQPDKHNQRSRSPTLSSIITLTDDPISQLEGLVAEYGWTGPYYRLFPSYRVNLSPSIKFLFSVTVNGKEYSPSGTSGPPADTALQAKINAATFCLQVLMSKPTSGSRTDHDGQRKRSAEETSPAQRRAASKEKPNKLPKDDNGTDDDPVSRLFELARRKRWRKPKLNCINYQIAAPQGKYVTEYKYTVRMNGIDYKDTPPALSKKQAKRNAAEYCLEKINSASNSSNNTSSASSTQTSPTSTTTENNGHKQMPSSSTTAPARPPTPTPPVLPPTPVAPPPTPTTTNNSIQSQLGSVQNAVLIPSSEYNKVMEMTTALKAAFVQHHPDPEINVVMFRNYFLWLNNPSTLHHELFIFCYIDNTAEDVPNYTIQSVFGPQKGGKDFRILAQSLPNSEWKLEYKRNGVKFRLVTSARRYIMEVQMRRMVRYLCTFDPRCESLMSLAYYWTKVNSVSFGEITGSTSFFNFTASPNAEKLPEPVTLQWLVVFFLAHRKIIPSPGEIQGRAHDVLRDVGKETDVGFNPDSEFAGRWLSARTGGAGDATTEEAKALKALTLFQEFLQFCGEVLFLGGWNNMCMLNTRDGELTALETENRGGPSTRSVASPAGGRANCDLQMMNPFNLACDFSISKNIKYVLKLMRHSGVQLRAFLETWSENGEQLAMELFGSLEDVLKIDGQARLSIV